MRECPFCKAGPSRLRVIGKWGSGRGVCRRRVAYVMCLGCFARGPTADGFKYDVRNAYPTDAAREKLHAKAIELWDGTSPIVTGELKLESEVAK